MTAKMVLVCTGSAVMKVVGTTDECGKGGILTDHGCDFIAGSPFRPLHVPAKRNDNEGSDSSSPSLAIHRPLAHSTSR